MKMRCALLFACSLLYACALGYVAEGSLSDVAGRLRGKAYPAPSGGGLFMLNGSDGLICNGTANAPTWSPHAGSCEGEAGDGLLRCTDGRELVFSWQARSCRSLAGEGVDAQGNRFEFQFGRR